MSSILDSGRSLAGVLTCALLLFSCDGNISPSRQVGEIGAAGGQIMVTSGPLAGTMLTVPASAVPDATAITIDQSATPVLVGFRNVGPGANFAASSVELAMPAGARLIFDPAMLPMGTTAASVRVAQQNSQGRRVTLMPTAVDLAAGTVDVRVDAFASYWVVLNVFELDLVLANYLPLIDGDTYLYDNGVGLQIDMVADEPNLEGLFVSRATFTDGTSDFGYYLAREFAKTNLFGEFSLSGDWRSVGVPPLLLLPETGRVGSVFTASDDFVLYRPFASFVPVDVLNVQQRVSIVSQGRLDTPLGRFSNVIEVQIQLRRVNTDLEVETTVDRLWLARGVGPVRIELSGSGRAGATIRGSLVAGLVGGDIIFPR